MNRTRLWALGAVAVVLMLAGLAGCGSGSGSSADVAAGTDAQLAAAAGPDDFYVPPSPLPAGAPGDIIRSRPAKAGPPTAQGLANAWQVMYLSQDVAAQPIATTGIVLVPKAGNPATKPIVGFGPGTSGPAFRCAPSVQIDGQSFYEQPAINDMLQRGYAVAVADYEGYHPDPTTTYMVPSMGNALIDVVRAAQRLPEAGLEATTPVVFRGYSQGGGAAMWAGQIEDTYAPELDVVGVAAGGVPADLIQVGAPLERAEGFGFFFYALVGQDNAYADLSLAPHLNDAGRAAVAKMKTDICVLELITELGGHSLFDYVATSPLDTTWINRLNSIKLGADAPKVPVYQYHEPQDGLVAFPQAETLKNTYCAAGVNLTWVTLDSQGASGLIRHINLVYRGNAGVNSFVEARIAGTPATSNC